VVNRSVYLSPPSFDRADEVWLALRVVAAVAWCAEQGEPPEADCPADSVMPAHEVVHEEVRRGGSPVAVVWAEAAIPEAQRTDWVVPVAAGLGAQDWFGAPAGAALPEAQRGGWLAAARGVVHAELRRGGSFVAVARAEAAIPEAQRTGWVVPVAAGWGAQDWFAAPAGAALPEAQRGGWLAAARGVVHAELRRGGSPVAAAWAEAATPEAQRTVWVVPVVAGLGAQDWFAVPAGTAPREARRAESVALAASCLDVACSVVARQAAA
jgi:hypothetical protein